MTDDTTEAVAGAAASLVLPIAIGVAAGWPVWVTTVVVAALLAVSSVAAGRRRRRRRQWLLRAEELSYEARHSTPPEPPPPLPAGAPLAPIKLPSALPDYRFTFTCTVHWQPLPHSADHAALAAVAADAVVQRALRITDGCHPEDEGAVHTLAAALGQRENDPGRHLTAWATDVRLDVEPEDRDRLRRVADMRKQQQVWEQEVAAERAVRAYLGQDVLTSTGSTVVWWLARNTGQVREAVDLIGTFARLSAAARDREVDEVFRHLAGSASAPPFTVNGHGVITEDAPARPDDDVLLDPDGHPVFCHQLAQLLEQHEAPDRAQLARERYGVADWDTDEPPEPPDDDN